MAAGSGLAIGIPMKRRALSPMKSYVREGETFCVLAAKNFSCAPGAATRSNVGLG